MNALRVMSKAKKETEDEEMESDEVQSATGNCGLHRPRKK